MYQWLRMNLSTDFFNLSIVAPSQKGAGSITVVIASSRQQSLRHFETAFVDPLPNPSPVFPRRLVPSSYLGSLPSGSPALLQFLPIRRLQNKTLSAAPTFLLGVDPSTRSLWHDPFISTNNNGRFQSSPPAVTLRRLPAFSLGELLAALRSASRRFRRSRSQHRKSSVVA